MNILEQCKAEDIKLLTDEEKSRIIVEYDGKRISTHRSKNTQANNESIEDILNTIRAERFYSSADYRAEFDKQLEIAILATRGGGSGAVACRDTLLSLYNGSVYKANLSGWYNLDNTNRKALLYILEHHTFNHAKAIDDYLPQYQADFTRMKAELSDDD